MNVWESWLTCRILYQQLAAWSIESESETRWEPDFWEDRCEGLIIPAEHMGNVHLWIWQSGQMMTIDQPLCPSVLTLCKLGHLQLQRRGRNMLQWLEKPKLSKKILNWLNLQRKEHKVAAVRTGAWKTDVIKKITFLGSTLQFIARK